MAKYDDRTMRSFEKYLALQKSGEMNMMSPQVQERLGITKEEHMFIVKNYAAILEEYNNLKVVDEVIYDAKNRVNGDYTEDKSMGLDNVEQDSVEK